jgi:hypothetical protein
MEEEQIGAIWSAEDDYIDDFQASRTKHGESGLNDILKDIRSVHFILKPIEDGVGELKELPPPLKLKDGLHLIPGRLTLHLFESKVAERWSGIYTGDPLAIRTATSIRTLARDYSEVFKYDLVILGSGFITRT